MNNRTTQIAVSAFVDRFLPPFLDRCATSTAYFSTLEGDKLRGTVIHNDDDDDEADDD
jgi:hypothetical protein